MIKTITRKEMGEMFDNAFFDITSNGGRALKLALSLDDRYIRNALVMGINLNIDSNDDPNLEIIEYNVKYENSTQHQIGVRKVMPNDTYVKLRLNPWFGSDV